MAKDASAQEPVWPLRTWVLMGLGALVCLAIQQLSDLPDTGWEWGKRLVSALILFLGTGDLAFSLSWRRGRHVPAAIMAVVCGAIAGGVMLWNGTSSNPYTFLTWPLCSGVVSAAVLLVLFQAADARHPHLPARWSFDGIREWKRQALHYSDVHEAAWTDALLAGISGIFTGLTFLIAYLLAEMFWLVKIDLLRELLRKDWVDALIAGAAYGGAMGLLRDRTAIIAALQRVAMIVLRVLAPVLAVGLVAFLAVLPFTGLASLWATGNTTPLMLSASAIALFLVNAVIGDKAEEAALARPLRWGAMALALAMLPLVAISVWSTGLRIDQRGLTPERLWALTFIILATITAIAYAVAILRRGDWVARLYRSNLHLAFILGGVSFILSTSLVSFDRISTADQLGRLASGRTKPIDFDYRGLWFDFGPPGKAAIKRLAASSPEGEVRKYAADIQKQEYSFTEATNLADKRRGSALDERITIYPKPVPLEAALRERLTDFGTCSGNGPCELYYEAGRDYAVAVRPPAEGCKDCAPDIQLLYRGPEGDWGASLHPDAGPSSDALKAQRLIERQKAADIKAGKFEIRTVERRQLFVNGEPYGRVIPMENAAEP